MIVFVVYTNLTNVIHDDLINLDSYTKNYLLNLNMSLGFCTPKLLKEV